MLTMDRTLTLKNQAQKNVNKSDLNKDLGGILNVVVKGGEKEKWMAYIHTRIKSLSMKKII